MLNHKRKTNLNNLSTDDCLEIFKKHDKTCYEYYINNAWFFGCSARNYAAYLKDKFSDNEFPKKALNQNYPIIAPK